jgi:tRNA dimethylallyltransferase
MPLPPLLVIVGATATGKTALAIELARRLEGEIISADSRQLYRGMDIGTAKPTPAEQAAARHWLIDVADPDGTFTLAAFLDAAHAALDDIWSCRRLPIVVGGTGQYVWALLEAWRVPRVPPDPALRTELERRAATDGVATILDELRLVDPASAASIDPNNARRIIRAIEVTRATGRRFSEWREKGEPTFSATVLGLRLDRAELYRRIDARVDGMIAAGLLDEVRRLNDAGFGCDLPSMSSIGYREICEHLSGECTLADAVARIKTETHRLARMQHTWFRAGDPRIHWLDADAPDLLGQAMSIAQARSASESSG